MMDSEDYNHDADDLGASDGDLYDDGMETWGDDSDEDPLVEELDANPPCQQENYTILSPANIRERQEEDIRRVSSVLSISRVSSCILLHRYNWSASRVQEEWFENEQSVRKAVGLPEKPVKTSNAREVICGICFDTYPLDRTTAAACGHRYCSECWKGYIGTSISDGPGCLALRCPDPSCGAAVGQDMINNLASNKEKEKYLRYLFRSYVEDNLEMKWCPSPGCEFAVEFVGSGIYDVRCKCSYSFCWNCCEEAHRPVDCETVARWILKNSSEAENTTWILANSKPCPKCKRPIEKNQGCMHMTCRVPCQFEFCWLCLDPWSKHRNSSCNRYTHEQNESENMRKRAKLSIERYTHYYERWASNRKSKQKTLADLHNLQAGKLDELREKLNVTDSQLKFIIEAWLQIAECRRVLQWTYAYGYYLPECGPAKKQFFEYLQGEAESGLERLHHCAEKELQVHLDPQTPTEGFIDFRKKLAGLTGVTRTYFENLVRALETGLQDVGSSEREAASFDIQGSSSRKHKRREPRTSSGSAKSIGGLNDFWSCNLCTFVNPSSATVCQICNLWSCERCTYSNPSSSSTCLMCSQQDLEE